MLVFGFTFDQDQPWASAALKVPNPKARMEILMDHALRQIPIAEGAVHES